MVEMDILKDILRDKFAALSLMLYRISFSDHKNLADFQNENVINMSTIFGGVQILVTCHV